MKILFMDDNPSIRENFAELGDLLGYEVHSAANGYVAIELYRNELRKGLGFDAAILDLTIQGSDLQGIDVARKLNEIDPKAKCIVFSGHTSSDLVSDFRTYGFVAKLEKPLKIDQISRVLNSLN